MPSVGGQKQAREHSPQLARICSRAGDVGAQSRTYVVHVPHVLLREDHVQRELRAGAAAKISLLNEDQVGCS